MGGDARGPDCRLLLRRPIPPHAGGYTSAAIMALRDPPVTGRVSTLLSAYSSEVFQFCCKRHWWRRLVAPDGQPALGRPRAGPTACWLDGKVRRRSKLGQRKGAVMPVAPRATGKTTRCMTAGSSPPPRICPAAAALRGGWLQQPGVPPAAGTQCADCGVSWCLRCGCMAAWAAAHLL